MQNTFTHRQSYYDDKKRIPLYLERQEEDELSVFIMNLYQKLLPSKESYQKRIELTQKIEQILRNEWPEYNMQAHIFGSSVNNLGTSTSDVDLCITSPCIGFPDVRVLATLFRNYNMRNIICVPGAKVPIVRFFDPEYQLACDININNTIALENTRMVKTYVALDKRVRPLIMIIKHWTKQRDLNNAAYGGTLSSYTWTCMVINFLQTRTPPILPSLHGGRERFSDDIDRFYDYGVKNKETLGGLFFAFFRRFAIEFDYYTQVLSVHQGKVLTKSEKGWDIGRNRYCLCVEEPFNLTRNLANSADAASVRGIRMECYRMLSLLVYEKTGFYTLFDPYFAMRFYHHPRQYIQPLIQQQPNFMYNTSPFHHPTSHYIYSNNNNLIYPPQQQQQQHAVYGNYMIPPQQQPQQHHDGNEHNIPSTLLNILDLSGNYSHDRSVDSIFARYHREVLQGNERRRSPVKTLSRKYEDQPVIKEEQVSNAEKVINGTTEKKETQPQKTQSAKQKQQQQQNHHHQKPQPENQTEKKEEKPQQKQTHYRHRHWSSSKRKNQQEQQKESKEENKQENEHLDNKSRKSTENNQLSIENNSKPIKKRNKNKNRRRQKSSEQKKV